MTPITRSDARTRSHIRPGSDLDTPAPEMNTTPLIDVLLVLLVLMILTMPAITHQTTIDLPTSGGTGRVTPVTLAIDFDGRRFWNGEAVTSLASLEQRLRSHARQSPDTPVHVDADRRARYEPVAQTLAAVQRAGVPRIALHPIPD